MKMPASEFADLQADFRSVVDAIQTKSGPFDYGNKRNMWVVYNRVMDDRSYDDSHPFYVGGRQRILAFKDRRHNSRFYDMGLNDAHIETALRKIVAA